MSITQMNYTDKNGESKFMDFDSKSRKIFSIAENDDVYTIVNFSNEIRILNIENNTNLKSINKFPKSLDTLVITKNKLLENIYIPNVKISIIIFDNPMLRDIELKLDEYKKSQYYKNVFTKIITADEDDKTTSFMYNEDVKLVMERTKNGMLVSYFQHNNE
jgi:NACalpha-BTF3-like transcription factor